MGRKKADGSKCEHRFALNPRQLKFAQNLASGMSYGPAYADAYGHPKDKVGLTSMATILLQRRPQVKEHVERLRAESAKRVGITIDMITERLDTIALRCMEAEPVVDKEGNETGVYKFDAFAAIKANELLGKHLGMFVDKSKVDVTSGGEAISVTLNLGGAAASADED